MAHGWTRWHHEWLVKYAFADEDARPTSLDLLLYDDATDDLQFDSDVADLQSEVSGGNYTRQTATFGADLYTNLYDTNTEWRVSDAVTFDLTDASGAFDSYALIWESVTEKDKWEAWPDSTADTWEDEYVTDGPQPWEEDTSFDETAVAASDHLMLRGDLNAEEVAADWSTYTINPRVQVHALF